MSETQSAPPEVSRPAPPRRWLVAQASAVLEAVATENYVCYGSGGVPHIGAPAAPRSDPARMTLAFTLRDADEHPRLLCPRLDLRQLEWTARQSVWSGYDAERHLQVLWVWDFYRILSHVALRALLPTNDDLPPEGSPRRETLDALRAAVPGDHLLFEVQSACGDIHQTHILARAAFEWEH